MPAILRTDLLFGISSVAGVAIAVSQGNAGDVPVNAAGVVVIGALAFFDLGATGSQVDQAKEMMANDSLGKDLWSEDPAGVQASADGGESDEPGATAPVPGKVMSAADLGISPDEGAEES
mmetsp:Transcript_32815/g.75933  ORF Transcript_32815/g.75933 Transcript_32815/m.75933 type:complete len:120 (+) Transcript_32815:403-762(+)